MLISHQARKPSEERTQTGRDLSENNKKDVSNATMLWGWQRKDNVPWGNQRPPHEVPAFNLGQREASRKGREWVGIVDFAKGQPEHIRDQQRAISLIFGTVKRDIINMVIALGSRLRLKCTTLPSQSELGMRSLHKMAPNFLCLLLFSILQTMQHKCCHSHTLPKG